MRAVLPGRPQARHQAFAVGFWEGRQLIVCIPIAQMCSACANTYQSYISGNAFIVLDGPNSILQTTYLELPDELVAITFDEISGKIALASKSHVYVYKPDETNGDSLHWTEQCRILEDDGDDTVETLSWGLDEELLVGSKSLTLYSTHERKEIVWSRKLASPVKVAQFSHDTSLIASTGRYDKLVKIWRRISLADQRFDFAYLPHPTVVTGIHWRRPFHREQTFDNVLYTLCADNKLRIWGPGDLHSPEILKLWDTIDLLSSLQPRSAIPEARSQKRYAFIIDSKDITVATEHAVQQATNDEEEQRALGHLIEVANRSPEVVVVLDERGNMSAWGLDSVGCKHRKQGDIFNVAHVDGLNLHFSNDVRPTEDNVQFKTFCSNKQGAAFCLLVHHFDGRLEWYETRLDQFFDVAPQKKRLELKALCTGHSAPVRKVVRTATGKALVSRTHSDRSVVWVQKKLQGMQTLQRKSKAHTQKHIHRVWLLEEGDYVAFLHHDSISLWDTRQPIAVEVASQAYQISGKPLCLLCVPEEGSATRVVHLATISSEMKGVAWEVRLPAKDDSTTKPTLESFGTFDLGTEKDLAYVLPVDPAGTTPVMSGFLDTFARDVAMSWSTTGVVKMWTARLDFKRRKIEWLNTATVETSISNPSLGSATSIRKAAIVDADKTLLTIWNTRDGQLEHEEKFDEGIQDLDWASTPDNQSVLAVGFNHRILVYVQLRYDYLDARPSWAVVRELNIRDLTSHPIGDSVWLANGNFVIGAGNQLFIQDDQVEITDALKPDLRLSSHDKVGHDLFTIVSRLNGPLPVFHPQLLGQCILSGKIVLAQRILMALWRTLKFFVDGDPIDSMLGFEADDFSRNDSEMTTSVKRELHSSYADFTDEEPETLSEEISASLKEMLTTHRVPLLSSREQFHLADMVECVGMVEKHRRSIDENGCRFLLYFRQHYLRMSQSKVESVSWREVTWAFHSDSQDILADLVSKHFQGRMLWEHAKGSGIFMWMTDLTALRTQFEAIARNEYTKSDDKNPVDCSLYYMALKKKAVLQGLWRMAGWHREQQATQRLLANNFQEQKWKTAALRNAYALMGKRRFAYAAAFFLLAGNLKDAVSVLSNQLDDIQLAITIARVYEGDNGPVLKELLLEKVIPQANAEGNRWLATWAFWMLGQKEKAVRALVMPLSSLLSPPETPNFHSKLFLTDDPALVVLYQQLREKSLQTLRGALSVSPRAEWEFVLHNARLYERMGCDLLALDLGMFTNPRHT